MGNSLTRSLARRLLLVAMLAFMGMTHGVHAAERTAGKPVNALAGTWYSAEGAITFNANNTINFEGKKYFYAAGSGGLIQLTRKGSTRTIPYHMSGGKLTLTVNGKSQVYSRSR